MEPSEHLFRREAGRLVAVLTRLFGVHNLALVEDVVQDAFCRALEVWKFCGVPENPAAWLMATAKHCTLDVLRRERTARTFAPELGRLLESEWTLAPVVAENLLPTVIASPPIRFTPRRSVSLSYAAGGTRPRASTAEQRSHSRATPWSADSSSNAFARAHEAIRSCCRS